MNFYYPITDPPCPAALAQLGLMNFALSRSPVSWPLAERAWGSPVAKEDSRLVSCDGPCDSLGLAGLPKLFPSGSVERKSTDLDSSEMGSQSQPGLLPPAVTLSCPGCRQEGPGLARLDKGEAPLTVPSPVAARGVPEPELPLLLMDQR